MNVIVPMAGRGSRLRPHTLTVPKPLVPVGGKPIVHRLVDDIAAVCAEKIEKIAFVVGDFGAEVEKELLEVAASLGAVGSIHYQKQPLGTAHAVLCAAEMLDGPVVVAFADTLFKADFKISKEDEGILWVKQIEDPSAFGVIKMNDKGEIIDFVAICILELFTLGLAFEQSASFDSNGCFETFVRVLWIGSISQL
jgi:glucose-1-phosphate thymidylyltransferase